MGLILGWPTIGSDFFNTFLILICDCLCDLGWMVKETRSKRSQNSYVIPIFCICNFTFDNQ